MHAVATLLILAGWQERSRGRCWAYRQGFATNQPAKISSVPNGLRRIRPATRPRPFLRQAPGRSGAETIRWHAMLLTLERSILVVVHLQARLVPAVVADATSSRRREDHQATITRLVQAGVTIATTEMVVFEWLQHAGAPAFMELLALIK